MSQYYKLCLSGLINMINFIMLAITLTVVNKVWIYVKMNSYCKTNLKFVRSAIVFSSISTLYVNGGVEHV